MRLSIVQSNCRRDYFFWFIIGATIFIAFFVLFKVSLADEESIYDKARAIEVVKSQGGPGGCSSEAECSAFCSDSDNAEVCLNWARDNGIIKNEDFEKNIGLVNSGGPGGCKNQEICRAYCDDIAHSEECTDFAEKQGLISKEDAQRARKKGPGDCRTQQDCQTFCEQPQNQDTCLDYAVQEGFMSQKEVAGIKEFRSKAEEFRKRVEEFARQRAEEFRPPEVKEVDPGFDEQKAKQIIGTQGGPGGCKTFDECRAFCDDPVNQEICFSFAEEHQLFQNQGEVNKIRGIIKEGGPGGCHGEKTCREFCENPNNFEACLEFAQKHDLIPPQEVERARKGIEAFKEGGPLGCKDKDACEKICQNPANQEVCFEWARKHGLIPEEQLRFMEESKNLRQEFENRKAEFEGQRQPGRFQPPGSPPSGEFTPPPQFTRPPSDENENGIVCTQEFNPVCGVDHRTYPNPCFAKLTRVEIVYFGRCENVMPNTTQEFTPPPEFTRPPEFSTPPQPDPATECANRGGSWTGSACQFPTPPPTSLLGRAFGFILNSLSDFFR